MTALTSFLLAMQIAAGPLPQLLRAVPFESPRNIVRSSWVVLDANVAASGNLKNVETLAGFTPFLEVARSNAFRWSFSPARADSRVGVVFLFRSHDNFSIPPASTPRGDAGPNRPALPDTLVDPGYPLDSVGEGVTVLEVQISASGRILGTRVVADAPGLAKHTEKVVRSLSFRPAMRNGAAVEGNVVFVASYLRQLANPSQPLPPPTPNPEPSPGPRGTFTSPNRGGATAPF